MIYFVLDNLSRETKSWLVVPLAKPADFVLLQLSRCREETNLKNNPRQNSNFLLWSSALVLRVLSLSVLRTCTMSCIQYQLACQATLANSLTVFVPCIGPSLRHTIAISSLVLTFISSSSNIFILKKLGNSALNWHSCVKCFWVYLECGKMLDRSVRCSKGSNNLAQGSVLLWFILESSSAYCSVGGNEGICDCATHKCRIYTRRKVVK